MLNNLNFKKCLIALQPNRIAGGRITNCALSKFAPRPTATNSGQGKPSCVIRSEACFSSSNIERRQEKKTEREKKKTRPQSVKKNEIIMWCNSLIIICAAIFLIYLSNGPGDGRTVTFFQTPAPGPCRRNPGPGLVWALCVGPRVN